jgi:hypothetical protein
MKWIKNILREIFGLFVDDGSFALAILIWIGLMRWTISHLILSPTTIAIILLTGLALILVESTTRYARRKQPATKK